MNNLVEEVMRKALLGAFVLATVFSLGAYVQAENLLTSIIGDPGREAERIAIKTKVQDKVFELVTRYDNPHAKVLVADVINRLLVARPIPELKLKMVENDSFRGSLPIFQFVPLLKGDESVSPSWRTFISESSIFPAFYRPELQAVFLGVNADANYSPFWQAIMLLHESDHARDVFLTLQQHGEMSYQTRLIQEASTHAFETDLLEKIGGKFYREALDYAREKLRQQLIDSGQAPEDSFPPINYDAYDTRLDVAFPSAISREECGSRMTVLQIHALYELIEQGYSSVDDQHRAMVELMSHIYLQ